MEGSYSLKTEKMLTFNNLLLKSLHQCEGFKITLGIQICTTSRLKAFLVMLVNLTSFQTVDIKLKLFGSKCLSNELFLLHTGCTRGQAKRKVSVIYVQHMKTTSSRIWQTKQAFSCILLELLIASQLKE